MSLQQFYEADSASELYCSEKPAFTPHPNAPSPSRRRSSRRVSSTPYFPMDISVNLDNINSSLFTCSSDDKLMEDVRVIKNMLTLEMNNPNTTSHYLHSTNVNDNMRKILLRWMYEVVIDQQCDDIIFVQAASYLDRFLSTVPVVQGQLQLLGCCCLLLASKLRNCLIISAEILADLTDGCHSEEEICKFELVVLAKLGWDMTRVLPSDYLEPITRQGGLGHIAKLRGHAATFLSMATMYSNFLDYSPSFLACSTVYAALTYCEGRYKEEKAFLDFITKTFAFKADHLITVREAIFDSMNKELTLQDEQLSEQREQLSEQREQLSESREPDSSTLSSTDVKWRLLSRHWLQNKLLGLKRLVRKLFRGAGLDVKMVLSASFDEVEEAPSKSCGLRRRLFGGVDIARLHYSQLVDVVLGGSDSRVVGEAASSGSGSSSSNSSRGGFYNDNNNNNLKYSGGESYFLRSKGVINEL